MRKLLIKGAVLASSSCVALLAGSRADAQSTATPPVETVAPVAAQAAAPADQGGLADIIVTAQRRAENQQSVPIAVTTITAKTLATTGITTTDQLTALTPGLTFSRQINGAIPYIRGVGAQSTAQGVEGAVATYIDGVYYISAVGNLFSFNNVQRVEVLKGPQGTLFGRNATGGLVNVITRDPTVDPQLEANLSYGNYKDLAGTAYASAGSGNVAADIAVQFEHQGEGFGRYVLTGHDAYYQRNVGVRSKLLWEATPDDKFTFAADWARDRSDIGGTRDGNPGSLLILGIPPVGGYNAASDKETSINTRQYGASVRYEHKLDWGTVSFLNAYRRVKAQSEFDLDVTAVPFLQATTKDRSKSYQSELLLNGSVPRLDFTVGLFYLNATSANSPLAIRSAAVPPLNYDDFATLETRSYAGFAQGTYALTDTTKFTAGLRYTTDERTFSAQEIAVAPNPAGAGTVLFSRVADKASYPKLTWRFALDQQLAPHVLAYISYDRGFKSGTFNSAEIRQPPVRPETLDSFAAGLKSELFDRTLRANFSVFHYEYSDIQLARLENGVMVLLNAAKGRVDGADAELLFAPRIGLGSLEFSAGASYLNGKYKSFPDGPISKPNPAGGDFITSGDLSGNRMIRSPKTTFNVGAQFTVPLGGIDLNFTANYFHSASFFWEPDNRLTQPSYDLLNGSVGVSFGADKQYSIRAFGRNLTNSRYSTFTISGNLGDTRSLAPPRTYGVNVGVKF